MCLVSYILFDLSGNYEVLTCQNGFSFEEERYKDFMDQIAIKLEKLFIL